MPERLLINCLLAVTALIVIYKVLQSPPESISAPIELTSSSNSAWRTGMAPTHRIDESMIHADIDVSRTQCNQLLNERPEETAKSLPQPKRPSEAPSPAELTAMLSDIMNSKETRASLTCQLYAQIPGSAASTR